MLEGITRFISEASREDIPLKLPLVVLGTETPVSDEDISRLMAELPPRPAGLCTVSRTSVVLAIKQLQEEMGPFLSPLTLALFRYGCALQSG